MFRPECLRGTLSTYAHRNLLKATSTWSVEWAFTMMNGQSR